MREVFISVILVLYGTYDAVENCVFCVYIDEKNMDLGLYNIRFERFFVWGVRCGGLAKVYRRGKRSIHLCTSLCKYFM